MVVCLWFINSSTTWAPPHFDLVKSYIVSCDNGFRSFNRAFRLILVLYSSISGFSRLTTSYKMVAQLIPDRYIDLNDLRNLLTTKFGRGNFQIEVGSVLGLKHEIGTPQYLHST